VHEKAQGNITIKRLMNILSDDELALLDRHVSGKLDGSELEQVRHLIAENTVWREAYHLRMAIRETGRKTFHRDMRKQFASIDQAPRGSSVRPVWLGLAAGVALLISALLWFFPSDQNDDLLAEYVKFPNIVMPIQKSGSNFTNQQRAYQAYELNEYAQSIGLFQSLDSLSTPDSVYLALSYLEEGDSDVALDLLGTLTTSKDLRWSQVAGWYRMWGLLKSGRETEAKQVLEHIRSTPSHRYQTNAESLLKEI
jgi:hypothetical protein